MRAYAIMIALGLSWLADAALAVTQLKQGNDAPLFALKDVAGREVNLSDMRGRVVVLTFGELYHEKSRQTCAQIEEMLRDERLRERGIVPVLITAQQANDGEFKIEAARSRRMTVLRDPLRKAFGAYEVAAMPSVVVINAQGQVIVALAGAVPRLQDVIFDALLLATGQIPQEQFDQTLNPIAQASAESETAIKASRVASLARQLARRGMDEMAAGKFVEALQIDPELLEARQDLGLLLLKQGRLADAEKQLKAVLEKRPDSLQAGLALAFIQTSRGGGELNQAETTVRKILARQPTHPRAHYLLGMIMQQRGKGEEAMACYRKSAELLLERSSEDREP